MSWRHVIEMFPSQLINFDGFSVRLYSRYGARYCEGNRQLTLATEAEEATDRYGRTLLVFPTHETQVFIPTSLRWDDGQLLSGVESEIVIQRISAVFEKHMRPFRLIVGDEIYEKLADSDRQAANRPQPTAES